ncbi:DUF342 domain-containing protein [Pseudomonas viridiflava]|uniref:DUF342 domain-containing protein n=1 Tax=Pseudomonas viridiflava TaxID=33069 RepID=UPI0013CE6C64|nr:DUF342 domain-containing protein [Pseudomonas viridiflava]
MKRSRREFSRRRQNGMATIASVLLIGLAITVSTLSMIYGVRSASQKQMAVHSSTHSQSGAWAALDVVRKFLEQQAATDAGVTALKPLNFSMGTNTISVTWGSVVPAADGTTQVIGILTSKNEPARSASVLQATFTVVQGSAGSAPAVDLPAAVTIHNDLDMSGGIDFKGGDNARLVVEGNAKLGSASIVGLQSIKATKDISIGSGISVQDVFANGKLSLTGSGNVMTGSALGDITVDSGGSQGTLKTNGNLTISNGSVAKGDALGWIKASSGGSHGTLTAGGDLTVSNGTIGQANAVGYVMITSWPTTKIVNSQATVTCPSQYWSNYQSIKAKSTINCPTANVTAPAAVSISLMQRLTAFSVDPQRVDTYPLKDAANYAFEYENNRIKVTVQNVNGLADGAYWLGNYGYQSNRGWQNFLCQQVDTNNNCTLPSKPTTSLRTLCQGFSNSNGCVTYSKGVWSISGKNLAPGVMWFQGDVNASNGTYYNTFLATGNISTSGSHKTYGMNYAGYGVVCQNQYPVNKTADFEGMYPTNYCDMASGTLKANAIGNAAFLAGGYIGDIFSGGSITLGASTEVFGSVIAGDLLGTGGNSIVHGYINAAGQGTGSVNAWGGSTTIDLRDLPPGFMPGKLPSMDGGGSGSGSGGAATEASASIRWARYL